MVPACALCQELFSVSLLTGVTDCAHQVADDMHVDGWILAANSD
jgi:hypothetical protein